MVTPKTNFSQPIKNTANSNSLKYLLVNEVGHILGGNIEIGSYQDKEDVSSGNKVLEELFFGIEIKNEIAQTYLTKLRHKVKILSPKKKGTFKMFVFSMVWYKR